MPKFVQGYKPDNSDIVYPTYEEALKEEENIKKELDRQYDYWTTRYPSDWEYMKITNE